LHLGGSVCTKPNPPWVIVWLGSGVVVILAEENAKTPMEGPGEQGGDASKACRGSGQSRPTKERKSADKGGLSNYSLKRRKGRDSLGPLELGGRIR